VATFDTSFSVLSWFDEDRAKQSRRSRAFHRKRNRLVRGPAEDRNLELGKIEGRKALVVFTEGYDNSIQAKGAQVVSPEFESLLRDVEAIDSLVYLIHLTPALSDVPGASAQALQDFLTGKRQDFSPNDQRRRSHDLIGRKSSAS